MISAKMRREARLPQNPEPAQHRPQLLLDAFDAGATAPNFCRQSLIAEGEALWPALVTLRVFNQIAHMLSGQRARIAIVLRVPRRHSES